MERKNLSFIWLAMQMLEIKKRKKELVWKWIWIKKGSSWWSLFAARSSLKAAQFKFRFWPVRATMFLVNQILISVNYFFTFMNFERKSCI